MYPIVILRVFGLRVCGTSAFHAPATKVLCLENVSRRATLKGGFSVCVCVVVVVVLLFGVGCVFVRAEDRGRGEFSLERVEVELRSWHVHKLQDTHKLLQCWQGMRLNIALGT